MLKASCEKYSDDLFITYNEVSLTYQEFYAKVKELKNIYDDFNSVNDFVLVNEKKISSYYLPIDYQDKEIFTKRKPLSKNANTSRVPGFLLRSYKNK